MISIRQEKPADEAAREALLDAAYGAVRFTKPSQRLRAGRAPARGLSFVAMDGGRMVGTVRMWEVAVGADRTALLLGPLAVAPDCRSRGIGAMLMRKAMAAASRRGHRAVLLVGDEAYYSRFGFSTAATRRLWLPGCADNARLLAVELTPHALAGARGFLRVPDAQPRRLVGGLLRPLPARRAA